MSQNGTQAGDPDKAAELYIKVAEISEPYESLQIGTDSCKGIRQIAQDTVELMDAMLPVVSSTDY